MGMFRISSIVCASAMVLAMGMGARAIVPLPVPRPIPPAGWSYRWVAPVYSTITDRVWVAERVERVLDWIEVGPGRWERVYREVIRPAHWEERTRRVEASPGYWQLVRLDPVLPPWGPPIPRAVVGVGTVGVEGYSSGPGEDMSKFSPLREWPR